MPFAHTKDIKCIQFDYLQILQSSLITDRHVDCFFCPIYVWKYLSFNQ